MSDHARSLRVMIIGLGLGQIISWGQLYYSIAVLWPAIASELVLTQSTVYAIVSLALLLNGLALPYTGRWIDRRGGRPVMMTGSLLAALAFIILALAQNVVVYALGWFVGGLAMSMTMYDAAFASLSQHSGANHRRALTAVTLLGGLASTAFWPFSAWLLDDFGWRIAFAIFAGMQLLICLPLHALTIPRHGVRGAESPATARAHADRPTPTMITPILRRAFALLALAFMLHALVASLVAVHLIELLQHRGLTLAQAVLIGMAIGPAQVLGRLLDFFAGNRIPAWRLGTIAFVAIAGSMLVMILPGLDMVTGFAITILWGLGNGLVTITRGVIMAEVFPRADYGAWMGRMSRIAFVANASAPGLFAFALAAGMPESAAGWVFAAAIGGGLFAYLAARRTVLSGVS